MLFKSLAVMAAVSLLSGAVLAADPVAAPTEALAPLAFTPVKTNDFVAEYYPGTKSGYGILLVEGAKGGMPDLLAQKIAAAGYPVLAVAYFKEPGLPEYLEELQLEYLQKPKQWLLEQAQTRDDGLVMVGWSKGAELTLNTIARDADYKGAIAIAPTSVTWQGRGKDGAVVSSWTYKNKPLPFLAWPSPAAGQSINEAVLNTLDKANWQTHEARIPLEQTHAAVLLLSGGQDSVWPATAMAEQVCEHMQATLPNQCTHVDYPKAGHLLHPAMGMGGTTEANAEANLASQQVIERFLTSLNKT